MRCELKEPTEEGQGGDARGDAYLAPQDAFEFGILDNIRYPFDRYILVRDTVPLDKVSDGAYHTYDLGVHTLNAGMFVWITIADSKSVTAVYVDQVFLVRQEDG